MRSLKVFLLTLLCVHSVLCCDVPLAHYKTMKCTPVGSRSDGCPERYDCPSITAHDNSKCYFNGDTYEINQTIPKTGQFCSTCYCRSDDPFATFHCPSRFCPELFQSYDENNCVRQYTMNSCCSTGLVCGEERKRLATCEFENKIYREGQRMYFNGKPCRKCICAAGFNATTIDTDPNCIEMVCRFELSEERMVYGGGIPVYKKDDCCPRKWRMPFPNDRVVKGGGQPATDPKLQCKYGSLTLDIGDSLKIRKRWGEKMSCSCEVPPLMHCVLESITV